MDFMFAYFVVLAGVVAAHKILWRIATDILSSEPEPPGRVFLQSVVFPLAQSRRTYLAYAVIAFVVTLYLR